MPESYKKLLRSQTGLSRLFASIAMTAAVAGCAAPGGMRVASQAEPSFVRLTEERVFAQALRQRYLELATNAYDRGDLDRSDFYTLRAIMAVEGKLVEPAVADADDAAFSAARTRVASSLSNGARVGSPVLAARSQAAYDCWWLESQSDGDADIAEACRFNTFEALTELETIGVGSRLASARQASEYETQQVVVNSETPSQTIEAGGSTIQIINQPITYEAPPAATSHGSAGIQQSAVPHAQQRHVLSRTAQIAEPIQSESLRTFVVEAPQGQVVPTDNVIPTVPLPNEISEDNSLEPINLLPDAFALTPPAYAQAPAEHSIVGQYVVAEPVPSVTQMAPIRDTLIETVPIERYAALEPQFGPVYSDTPVQQTAVAPTHTLVAEATLAETLLIGRGATGADYSVFFGFDSDEITLEGQDILIDAVERLTVEDRGTVVLMGFTDSAGDSRYNQLLAMRRANAVRKYLQEQTDKTLNFEIMPVGEAEAVTSGGDGIVEALNRRVEIKIR